MSLASQPRSVFWTEHFNKLARVEAGNEQLDFSNQALVIQNYSFVLEACGVVAGKRVLDVGFGTGDLSCMLAKLGGKVSAFDVVATRIARLREEAPTIAWWHDDISTWKQPRTADPYDLIVACETLQYVEFNSAVQRLLQVLADDGRIVILIPNADCPIVRRVSERFDYQYDGISMEQIETRLAGISSEMYVAYRGIYFQEDQTLVPYQSGPWKRISVGHRLPSPHFAMNGGYPVEQASRVANRIQVVISKASQKPQSEETAQVDSNRKRDSAS